MKARIIKNDNMPTKDRTHNLYTESQKEIEKCFYKKGYIYLLKGDPEEHKDGFKSYYYLKGYRLSDTTVDIEKAAYMQTLGINSYFVSTTTDYMTAAAFSKRNKIYVIKIPVTDVYRQDNDLVRDLKEKEYLIPDCVFPYEVVASFDFNNFNSLFSYLTNEAGLDILPEDLGVTSEIFTKGIDYNQLQIIEEFNSDEIKNETDEIEDYFLKMVGFLCDGGPNERNLK